MDGACKEWPTCDGKPYSKNSMRGYNVRDLHRPWHWAAVGPRSGRCRFSRTQVALEYRTMGGFRVERQRLRSTRMIRRAIPFSSAVLMEVFGNRAMRAR